MQPILPYSTLTLWQPKQSAIFRPTTYWHASFFPPYNDARDEYFPERYYLDSYNDDSEYFTTIKEATVYVSEIMGKDVKPDKKAIGEALDEYMEEQNDEDVRYSFHEFTVMDE